MNKLALELNKTYKQLTSPERLNRAYKDFNRILITSSFGTTSALLFEQFRLAGIKHYTVNFVNTGFLFNETLIYKDKLAAHFGFDIVEIKPAEWRFELTAKQKLWETNPELCCAIKKIEPLEEVMNKYDLWISGIMAWQNDYRKTQDIFVVKHQILKFHPLIDIKSIEASQFYLDNPNLMHPLESLGYASVGCVHCTSHGVGREGRWASVLGKTECGLHL